MAIRRLELMLQGDVQGIGLRHITKREAHKLNITGWIKNCSDDTVEIVAEGEYQDLKSLLSWYENGPKSSYVSEIEKNWADSQDNLPEFEIRK